MNDDVVITFSRKRKLLLFFFAIGFNIGGLFLLLKAEELAPVWIIKNAWVLKAVGFITVLVFGSMTLLYMKMIFRRVAVVIDQYGIIEHSSTTGAGRVLWSEISEIKTHESHSASFILVFVKDAKEIIQKNKSWLERRLLYSNYKTYRTPVVIPMIALNIYIDDLESLLLDRLTFYRTSGPAAMKPDND